MESLRTAGFHEEETAGQPILLRPHHGMCLAYFEGKGYSEGFTAHMQRVLDLLTGREENLSDAGTAAASKKTAVRLAADTDEICAACPNNEKGVCREAAKVYAFDRDVLELCGLEEGQLLEFGEFVRLVQKNILSAGKRREICGSCQWNTICENRESRWAD